MTTETKVENHLEAGGYFFDDLEVGDYFHTGKIVITEAHIVAFAGISGDFFDVHMDDEFAKEQGFPGRIAHGLLGLAMVDGLKNRAAVQLKAIASLGWKNWDFKGVILPGDRIGVKIQVETMRLTSKKDRGIVSFAFVVTNQHEKIVQQGTNVLMMRLASNKGSAL